MQEDTGIEITVLQVFNVQVNADISQIYTCKERNKILFSGLTKINDTNKTTKYNNNE